VLLSAPLLRTLSLAGNTDLVLASEDIHALKSLLRLQELDLRGVQIQPAEAAQLARALPDVQLALDSLEEPWEDVYLPQMRQLEVEDWDAPGDEH
jgi:hypothetical protein